MRASSCMILSESMTIKVWPEDSSVFSFLTTLCLQAVSTLWISYPGWSRAYAERSFSCLHKNLDIVTFIIRPRHLVKTSPLPPFPDTSSYHWVPSCRKEFPAWIVSHSLDSRQPGERAIHLFLGQIPGIRICKNILAACILCLRFLFFGCCFLNLRGQIKRSTPESILKFLCPSLSRLPLLFLVPSLLLPFPLPSSQPLQFLPFVRPLPLLPLPSPLPSSLSLLPQALLFRLSLSLCRKFVGISSLTGRLRRSAVPAGPDLFLAVHKCRPAIFMAAHNQNLSDPAHTRLPLSPAFSENPDSLSHSHLRDLPLPFHPPGNRNTISAFRNNPSVPLKVSMLCQNLIPPIGRSWAGRSFTSSSVRSSLSVS